LYFLWRCSYMMVLSFLRQQVCGHVGGWEVGGEEEQ